MQSSTQAASATDRTAPAPALLRTRGLTKEFRGFAAVQGVDLDVAEGSIHALVGPNGAGKTTLFNMIAGIYRPSSGEILFNGDVLSRASDAGSDSGTTELYQPGRQDLQRHAVRTWYRAEVTMAKPRKRSQPRSLLHWLSTGEGETANMFQIELLHNLMWAQADGRNKRNP